MSSQFKAVIYDCDGVMFDSFEANFAFYQLIMGHMGHSLDRSDHETMRVLHTYANREVLAHFFPEPDQCQEAIRFAGSLDYRELIPMMVMEEEFVPTLELLQDRVQLAVCTNRSTSMDAVLTNFGLSHYFGCVMTACQVTNPKPHPEPLNRVLAHYGLAPTEALFVGDSDVDRQAAAAAGVPFVAYKADLPAFARIDRHGEIVSLLG
ncbi:MAG TPA: HAD family hydrolase [Geobacteraceae bacterium]